MNNELKLILEDCVYTMEKQQDEIKQDLKNKELSKEQKKIKKDTIYTIEKIKEKTKNRLLEL